MLTTKSTFKVTILGFAFISSFSSLHALDLIVDDFSSGSFTTGTKFTNSEVDNGWHKRSSNGPDWAISGGALTNSAANLNDEKPAFILNTVSGGDASLTQINVSFDYVVGTGSTLYFHSALMKGALGTLDAGVSNSNGSYTGEQYTDGFSLGGVNLKDGSNPINGDLNSIATVTGTGNFSQTFDISGYTGISNITDVSHILAVFASDSNASNGAISIDNLSITAVVPEPGTFALLAGLTGLAFVMLRRRA